MLFVFQRELGLAGEQLRHFRAVLKERDSAFDEIREEVQRTKIVNVSLQGDRIESIRALYFERMARFLDTRQHRRFRELVAENNLGDGVVIPLPEDVRIID